MVLLAVEQKKQGNTDSARKKVSMLVSTSISLCGE